MPFILDQHGLDRTFLALKQRGYELVGPTLRDQAIVYDTIHTTSDLPLAWTDEQDGGVYRLKKRSDAALFGYAVGPHSWKKFLHPPIRRLWTAKKEETGFQVIPEEEKSVKYAFIGVRACELRAIEIQDRVFLHGNYQDPSYKKLRENAFIVALNCGQAGGTCFCVSMNAGPKAKSGFDLALTEVIEADRHYFLVEVGSEGGNEILQELSCQEAGIQEQKAAQAVVEKTARQMGREMDTANIKELLYKNYEHPRWNEVAERCLSCGNCTMVCPTCFCTTVEDVTDLKGEHSERWQKWDSCFTLDFSYMHGSGPVRSSTKSRYRQWMTHKLATWIDQFGSSGCVGCGRCITWCPVGIDLTEELAAIRRQEPEAEEVSTPIISHEVKREE
ncbi:MAG TPA: sulfite reductase subunit A [Deltaproteobacteria bacterium]|nr:sulfite reductase subunit A [Deltaproteobacteria bacterium]